MQRLVSKAMLTDDQQIDHHKVVGIAFNAVNVHSLHCHSTAVLGDGSQSSASLEQSQDSEDDLASHATGRPQQVPVGSRLLSGRTPSSCALHQHIHVSSNKVESRW